MKTEEDEAFDELARRQGDWGGGFQAKRAMAAAKLQEPAHCQCFACKDGVIHASDCAVHNGPAYPAGPCDCGVAQEPSACCHACFKASGAMLMTRIILCPSCGNKRCPKASNHRLECTDSNESGQAGSVYTAAQPAQKPVAWRRREVGGLWQYFGWEETGMTYQFVERWNKNGFECEAIPATPPQEKNND